MGLAEDVEKAVTSVVCSNWNTRSGTVVPETEDVSLSNGAVEVDAVYLYADLANSTSLARDFTRTTAAKGTCPRVVDTSEPGPGRGRVGGIFYGDEGLLA
ncbi:hypothetical protein ACPCK9_32720, partial [Streptomyces koyangensis]|uniref:hypothetical protein n=1 Tax=Streptomyces koyangensis TaxID=188770 RepID=UPI003C2E354E